MKRICLVVLLLSLLPFFMAAQTDSFQHLRDSFQNIANVTTGEEKIMALREIAILPYTDYDEMFKANENLLNEARRQGNVKAQAFAMVNELMNYYNTNRYGEYEEKADAYLQFMLSHPEGRNYYFYAYPVLLEIYNANGDYYKALQGARQLYETAKEYDNALGVDASTYSIAVAYENFARYDDAYRFYKLTLESQKTKEVRERSYQLQTYSDLFDLMRKKELDISASALTAEWRAEIIRTEREADIDYHHWAWADYYQSMTDYFISHEDLTNAKLYYDSIPMYNDEAVSRCTGKTFKTWLNEYRIKEAIRLLSDKNNSTISIDALTFESGFSDRTTFYRVFKKMTGISPTDFKKNGLHK